MAIIVDNIHLINSVTESDRSNIIILRVTEKEIRTTFQEYRKSKFSENKTNLSKQRGHLKRKYQKYHKDIRRYIRRYHLLKLQKDG